MAAKIISPCEREVEGWRETKREEKVEVPAQKIGCASMKEMENREEKEGRHYSIMAEKFSLVAKEFFLPRREKRRNFSMNEREEFSSFDIHGSITLTPPKK